MRVPDLGCHVPACAALSCALPRDAGAGVAGSLEHIPLLSGLLPIKAYTVPLLEGLIASVGGVDASLAKAAGEECGVVYVVVAVAVVKCVYFTPLNTFWSCAILLPYRMTISIC